MQKTKSYECTTAIGAFAVQSYVHRRIRPSVGQIKRVATQVFKVDDMWTPMPWVMAIEVRTSSLKEPPVPGHYEVLTNDLQLHAFKHAWSEAVLAKQSNVAEWGKAARSIKVRFSFCPDALSAERRKFEADAVLVTAYEERNLAGFNIIQGLLEVSDVLSSGSKTPSSEDIAAFLSKAKMKNMSAKTVSMCLKISRRFTEKSMVSASACILFADRKFVCQHCEAIISELDSVFGPTRHSFGVLSLLDLVCQKTAAKSNAPTALAPDCSECSPGFSSQFFRTSIAFLTEAEKLLIWVLEDYKHTAMVLKVRICSCCSPCFPSLASSRRKLTCPSRS